MPEPLRLIISGGGSGGHLFPALAIADEVRRRYPNASIHFVGARGKIEMDKVPPRQYPITGLWISGYNRREWKANLSLPLKVVHSLAQAWRLLRRHQPHAVIGVGGFASLPIGWMAARMGYPLILQEQNAFPGLVNRKLGDHARLICAGFPGLERYFRADKIVVTGNPVRHDLLEPQGHAEEARSHFGLERHAPVILVLGGSSGARSINEGVLAALSKWLGEGYAVIWQTGLRYHAEMQDRAGASPGVHNLFITPFLDDMPMAYAAANVVISRAGAISLSELACQRKASILVPSPHVADDHQTKNARELEQYGAAIVILDHMVKEQLPQTAAQLLKSDHRQKELSENIRSFCRSDAAGHIVDRLVGLLS